MGHEVQKLCVIHSGWSDFEQVYVHAGGSRPLVPLSW